MRFDDYAFMLIICVNQLDDESCSFLDGFVGHVDDRAAQLFHKALGEIQFLVDALQGGVFGGAGEADGF
ncbi:hypothetical protein D3C87_2177410 [compost metagenome]